MLSQAAEKTGADGAVLVRKDQLQRVDAVFVDAAIWRAVQRVIEIVMMRNACLVSRLLAHSGEHGQRMLAGKGVTGIAQLKAQGLPREFQQRLETGKDVHDKGCWQKTSSTNCCDRTQGTPE